MDKNKIKELYMAINHLLLALLNNNGVIHQDSNELDDLSNALYEIDGGIYSPDIFENITWQG